MPAGFAVAGNDDPEHNRDEGEVGVEVLRLECDDKGEEGCEGRSGGPDSLVEGHRDEAQGHVAEHDGEGKDGGEADDLEELPRGRDVLERDDLDVDDGKVRSRWCRPPCAAGLGTPGTCTQAEGSTIELVAQGSMAKQE